MACKSYYTFVSCCDGTEIKFCKGLAAPSFSGVFVYDGTSYNSGNPIVGFGGSLEFGKCYNISTTSTLTGNFTYPPFTTAMVPDFTSVGAFCDTEPCTCTQKTVFTPCCGDAPISFLYEGTFSSQFNVYQYPVGSPLLFGLGGTLLPGSCYAVSFETATPEELAILTAGPTFSDVTYVGKFCSNINPGVDCLPCNYYYQVTNCADETETYCTTSNLSAYINNLIEDSSLWPVIQITEKPGKCFYVEQIATCIAPIPLTPDPAIPSVIGCAACQTVVEVYYELINCNDPQIIVYTSTDLSTYVGDYIKLEEYANECFYVQVADGLVPSDIPVTPTGDIFQTCESCTLPTYLLTDCTGVKNDIVTNADLSAYVGSVVVIETCPETCWTVEETDITSSYEYINVTTDFTDCPECLLAILSAKCVSFTNTSEKAIGFEVLYPDLSVNKFTIQSGATLAKDCYLQWETVTGLVVTNYGLCINGVCPEVPKPKRKVTPGYDTPACTPQYYENVECNFSEWMYKDVLEKRYGISNCCPEELMKWEIKHEMLMLDSLINPDYTCQPTTNCGCPQPTTCSCSCNSGN